MPNVGDRYDLSALTVCARRIKRETAAAHETRVTVTASPNVPYDAIIRVMDALRADGEGKLFPEVTLRRALKRQGFSLQPSVVRSANVRVDQRR